MTRITRSQKVHVAEDSTALTSQVSSLDGAPLQAQILADLPQRSNTMPVIEEDNFNIDASLKSLKAAYRSAIGSGRKNKKGKNNKKKDKEEAQAPDLSQALGQTQDQEQETVAAPDEQKVVLQPDEPHVHREIVVEEQISTTPTDQKVNDAPEIEQSQNEHKVSGTTPSQSAHPVNEHSVSPRALVEQFKLKEDDGAPELVKYLVQEYTFTSPPKSPIKTLDQVEKECVEKDMVYSAGNDTDDSFVENIICRSPAKPVSRIEDSVEALDQLEDAFDALDQAVSAEQFASPQKSRYKTSRPDLSKPTSSLKETAGSARATSRGASRADPNVRSSKSLKPGYASMRVKPVAPRAPILKRSASLVFKQVPPTSPVENANLQLVKKAASKRPMSLLPPKELVRSSKPPTQPMKYELPGEIVARKLKEQREARLAQESNEDAPQPGRVVSATRVKSTKPPTKAVFELPGEALSRRKREAHEARLKAQEEEERKRREFKAKPIRTSTAPAPRDTVSSRARQSKVGIEIPQGGNLSVAKRGSNIRPSILQSNAVANSSAPRAPGPRISNERKPSTKFNGPSMSGMAMQRTVSSHEQFAQRQRAKEIYNRDIRATEDIEREKREREAAAKRSREEAAERGRQASREWAEKQRMKKLAEGDKGMGIGYGPGGQMGLRG